LRRNAETAPVKYEIADYLPQGGLLRVRIRWHRHSCFEVAGSVVVVTDPHDGKALGIAPPEAKADLILVSHDHFDHNCSSLVARKDATVISEAVMTVEKGVRVEGLRAAHDGNGGAKRGPVVLFKFELDGMSFCHLGDLGHALDESTVDRIAPVDFLFVPVGDVFTIGPETAKRVVDDVAPRVAVPMHYRTPGLSLSIKPVDSFLGLCSNEQVVNVGNEVDFGPDDLPSKGTEVWVFSS
jgi:L-ascorbate metabolism protein UlaG (beta-lactamase superfamily)